MSNYPKIDNQSYEKGLSIFLLVFVVLAYLPLIFWLLILWTSRNNRRYKYPLQIRRTHIVVISYLIIAWLLEEVIANIYLYYTNTDRSTEAGQQQWTYLKENVPIFYSEALDHTLHFLFWIAFWSFVQLKVFRFVHIVIVCNNTLYTIY